MATVHPAIQRLWDYGHFNNPAFPDTLNVQAQDLDKLTLSSPEVIQATASIQDFMGQTLDELCLKHHSRPAIHDGQIGSATLELLLQTERCGHPDYGYLDDNGNIHRGSIQAAIGSGNWQGCRNVGNFHCAVVRVKNPNDVPSHLAPVFEDVKERVTAAYAEMGLLLIWSQTEPNPEIEAEFVRSSSGWIGLALLGHGRRCGQTIWCKYLSSYRGRDVLTEWTTLFKHEIGHNCGLQHSRGGVMNPSIISGIGISWKGDPHESTLRRMFGGQPVPIPGPDPGPGPGPTPSPKIIVDGKLTVMTPDGKSRDFIVVPAKRV